MYLFDLRVIAADAVDHRRQLTVETEHQVYAQTVIRCIKQRPALLAAQLLQLAQAVGPARGAAHHGSRVFDAGADIGVGRRGHGEFQRHVHSGEIRGVEVRGVVGVDHERHVVTAFDEYFFDLAAHFAVTYDSCFHAFCLYCRANSYKDNTTRPHCQIFQPPPQARLSFQWTLNGRRTGKYFSVREIFINFPDSSCVAFACPHYKNRNYEPPPPFFSVCPVAVCRQYCGSACFPKRGAGRS